MPLQRVIRVLLPGEACRGKMEKNRGSPYTQYITKPILPKLVLAWFGEPGGEIMTLKMCSPLTMA